MQAINFSIIAIVWDNPRIEVLFLAKCSPLCPVALNPLRSHTAIATGWKPNFLSPNSLFL
jgi:hypothetical protein